MTHPSFLPPLLAALISDLSQTILVVERTSATLPITNLEAFVIPKSNDWRTRAANSPPSKYEYELSLRSAASGIEAMTLVPGMRRTAVLPEDKILRAEGALQCPEQDAQCSAFSSRFDKATFLDTQRAEGSVDLNTVCSRFTTEGRQTFGAAYLP